MILPRSLLVTLVTSAVLSNAANLRKAGVRKESKESPEEEKIKFYKRYPINRKRYDNPDGTVCYDRHEKWADSEGITCEGYVANGYCNKETGTRWGMKKVLEEVNDQANLDIADHVCCGCGGGETMVLSRRMNATELEILQRGDPYPNLKEGTVCYDLDPNFKDGSGYTCADYKRKNICIDGEGVESASSNVMGIFEEAMGRESYEQAAEQICCACGGGKEIVLPGCVGDCDKAKGDTVEQVRMEFEELKDKIRKKVSKMAAADASIIASAVKGNAKDAEQAMTGEQIAEAQTAFEHAEHRFQQLTTPQEDLFMHVKNQMVAEGAKSSRAVKKDLQVDGTKIAELATKAQDAWTAAVTEWESANSASKAAAMTGVNQMKSFTGSGGDIGLVTKLNQDGKMLARQAMAVKSAQVKASMAADIVKAAGVGIQAKLEVLHKGAAALSKEIEGHSTRLIAANKEVDDIEATLASSR
eukprot:TRINITY_DN2270_c0_g1_i1.p1 TRINITY_DN2270_c0_g1~~TRINITY_DN2270_c0_g1_i1.p1  ORF type:complete len:472 (-),score=114.09 TRINITY_DN2270_c0_g1_i1:203-1618(-)